MTKRQIVVLNLCWTRDFSKPDEISKTRTERMVHGLDQSCSPRQCGKKKERETV